jgi:DNA polymerase III subunit delta
VGGALEPGQLAELTSPSLFGERRVLVVRDVEQLPKEVVDEVIASCRDLADEVVIVLVPWG